MTQGMTVKVSIAFRLWFEFRLVLEFGLGLGFVLEG